MNTNETMNMNEIQSKLSAPFDNSDIEWRLQWNNDQKGLAVPYVDNRAIQSRLDGTLGIGNWKNEYIQWHNDGKKQSQICGISIYFEDRKEWITKYDGAENSDIESIKGGLSDSMKRAAVQWGIGRYLYSMDAVWVDVEKDAKGKATIKKDQQLRLDKTHQDAIAVIFGGAKPNTTPTKPNVQDQAASKSPIDFTQPNPASTPATQATLNTNPTQQQAAASYYYVMNAVIQPTAKGQNTSLQLKDQNELVTQAYLQGAHPDIAAGVWINAIISQKTKEGVVFYTVDSYTVVSQKAA